MTDPSQRSPFPPQVPPPLPASVVPYATPMAYQPLEETAAWREGEVLIVLKQSFLPRRCVKCNADVVDGWRWKKTIYWHHPALALMIIFPGLLIYAIVALCVRQKAVVEASLCEEHRARRNMKLMFAWLAGLGSFGVLFGGIAYGASIKNGESWIIFGLIGFVVLLIVAIVFGNQSRVLFPSKIDATFAWLKGACPEFLSAFSSLGQ